jgi:cell division protein FtsN
MRTISRRHGIRQHGGTALGVIIGLVTGLAIALVVAIYITNAPVPFVTKVQRPTDNAPAASTDGRLPDPNRPLYGNVPMPKGDAAKVEPPKAEASKAEPPKVAAVKPGDKAATPDDATRYLLQAGAFRTPVDADAMRARLALLGLDAKVYPIEQGGSTLYRVRVGPYGSIEDINRIRKVMAENNIEAQVVRLK